MGDFREQLRVLVEVARFGTMTQAARECHFSLSTVSRYMSSLEQATGGRLVERGEGRSRLTDHGWRTVAVACPILCAADALAGIRHDGQGEDGDCPAGRSLPCSGFATCPGRLVTPNSRLGKAELVRSRQLAGTGR